MNGKFITFEGLDGCGKSTQMGKLAASLRARGIAVLTTREPGGTPVGEDIRRILLDSRTASLSPLAEMGLMFASRAQQIDEVILPALQAGTWVLCDRFTDSSEAYQGGGRGLGSATILQMHQIMCRGLQPDLTILMLSDIGDSIARARRRNSRRPGAATVAVPSSSGAPANFSDATAERPGNSSSETTPTLPGAGGDENRFEIENRDFFKRVLDAFLVIAHREPHRVVRIDALLSMAAVERQILAALDERLAMTPG